MGDPGGLEERFLRGEALAYATVARWIAQALTSPRFRLLRSEWKDLHQETLRRVVESLRRGRFDASRSFRVYVQSIARYVARDALTRELRRRGHITSEAVQASSDAVLEAVLQARELAAEVLTRIPPGCRRLFRLLFQEELNQAEIAERLDVPIGTIKSRTFRCLKKAREVLFELGTARRYGTTEKVSARARGRSSGRTRGS